jgi:hypothetical protein
MLMMLDALSGPYHGVSFGFDRDKDWYLTDDGCAANPVCTHADNQKGVKVKLQVSTREQPVLPVTPQPQVTQDYFRLLGFAPADIPCLAFEEIVAEKIRAASQRSKIRDLHDLAEIASRPLNRELVRALAVLKLWNSGGPGLDYERFRARIMDGGDYDLGDLENLLRKDQRPDLDAMMRRVVEAFRFLSELTDRERTLAEDGAQRLACSRAGRRRGRAGGRSPPWSHARASYRAARTTNRRSATVFPPCTEYRRVRPRRRERARPAR